MNDVLNELYREVVAMVVTREVAAMAVTLTMASHTVMDAPYYGKRANCADRGNNFRLRGYGSECVLHPCDGENIYTYKI